jgi:hypothetical protein
MPTKGKENNTKTETVAAKDNKSRKEKLKSFSFLLFVYNFSIIDVSFS